MNVTCRQAQELQRRRDNLKQAHVKLDEQKAELVKKEEELQSLQRANQKKEQELKAEIVQLKEQSKKDKEELSKVLEKTQQVSRFYLKKIFICGRFVSGLAPPQN